MFGARPKCAARIGCASTCLARCQRRLFVYRGRDAGRTKRGGFSGSIATSYPRGDPHSVAQCVARFNQVGLAAVERSRGDCGPALLYGAAEREGILADFRRSPDRERDGTATWSLNTLQRALRRAPDGLPKVSTYTTCLSVVCHSILACSSEAHESVTHCGGSSGITPSGISRLEEG